MLRARVTGVRGTRPQSRQLPGCPRPGIAGARVHGHLPRPPRVERAGRGRPLLDRPAIARAGRAGCSRSRSNGASTSASGSTSAIRCGSTSSAERSRRASRACARSSGRTRATAASCSSSVPGRSTRRRTATSASFARRPRPAARGKFQRDLVAGFPNVSAIDVREIMATVQTVLDNVTLAISIVGGIALTSGVLILTGAVAMTKFQRVYEAAILRTLGASTRLLATMLALEYSALGLLAGLVGAAGAMALSWAACRFVFRSSGGPCRWSRHRRACHDGPRRRRRRAGERRRAPEEAAGDPARRVIEAPRGASGTSPGAGGSAKIRFLQGGERGLLWSTRRSTFRRTRRRC